MPTEQIERDPFYYGVRRHISADVHGQPLYDEQPLRQEDFLNPTDDDHFELGPNHDQDVTRLYRILQNHHRHNQLMQVFQKTNVCWLDSSLDQPRADVIVASSDSPKQLRGNSFDVEQWGQPPLSIIEVVSPRFVEADLLQKVELYRRGGVQEYFIVDSGIREERSQPAYSVHGFRLDGADYVSIQADSSGLVHSEVNQVKLGPNPERNGFVVVDLRSGDPIDEHDIQQAERIAEVQGDRRAEDIGAALDFLRD